MSFSFADRVRALRAGAGLTQAELAERAGISERTVSDLERGLRGSVYPPTARRLADALGIPDEARPDFLSAAGGDHTAARFGADPGAMGLPVAADSRLPLPLTRLVGRDDDLSDVLQLLAEGARLVTIVGPGGVGKTRLAIEVARRAAETDDAAVHFVDLSPIDDPTAVLGVVAHSVGVPVVAADLLPRLTRAFAGRTTVLLLDTMEHLLDAAPAVAQMLATSPGLTVLVTSRSPLKISGERQWPLRPLPVGVPGDESGNGGAAVELFFERARESLPAAPENRESRAIVRSICDRLDGLPLAIELAAARVRHIPLEALRHSLNDRLAPLTGGRRDAPARHQTMRAALEWSEALLDDAQRSTLRALSVFRGGFTADAVSAVVVPPPSAGAQRTMDALVDASLVVVEHGAREARYAILDVVVAYALEQATGAGEYEALQRSHAEYFLGFARRAEAHLRGADQRAWLARLLADEANLRAAVTWAVADGNARVALGLTGALWMFWRWAGLFDDARRWLDAALAVAADRSPARLPVLWGAGWLAFHQGDYERTERTGREMLELASGVDHTVERRNGLTLVGNAALALDRDAEAVARLREALSLCDDRTPPWVRATSLLNLATALSATGQVDEAVRLGQDAAREYERVGDRHFVARAQLQLAYAALRRGEGATATEWVTSALDIIRGLGDTWSLIEGLEVVAALLADVEPERAAVTAGAAERAREQIAMRAHPADARINRDRMDLARARLGVTAFQLALQRGRETPLASGAAGRLLAWPIVNADSGPQPPSQTEREGAPAD